MPSLPFRTLCATALCVLALTAAPAPTRADEMPALKQAKSCTSNVPPFGNRSARAGGYIAPSGTIEMDNDGGWCWARLTFRPNGGPPYVPPLKILQPPAHGELTVGNVGDQVRFAYRPKPGYTGPDTFTVNAVTPSNTFDVPITVTVIP